MITTISNAISPFAVSFNRQSKATKVALGALALGVVGFGIYAAVSWMKKDVKAPEVPNEPPKGKGDIVEPPDLMKVKEDSFDRWQELPQDVLLKIFSNMNIAHLGRCANVCKNWKVRADDPRLWEAIARSQVLGKQVWEAASLGDVGVEPEYRMLPFNGMDGEELSWKEVCKMHKKPSSYRDPSNGLVMIKMPEFDFLVPATINGQPTTINLVIEVFKRARLQVGCRFIHTDILKNYGDVTIQKSYFARCTWTVVNNTRITLPKDKSETAPTDATENAAQFRFDEIHKKGKQLYRLPKIIEMMIFQFLSYQARIDSGYTETYSQCSETLLLKGKETPVYAGSFKTPVPDDAGGLFVHYIPRVCKSDGAGALREL